MGLISIHDIFGCVVRGTSSRRLNLLSRKMNEWKDSRVSVGTELKGICEC